MNRRFFFITFFCLSATGMDQGVLWTDGTSLTPVEQHIKKTFDSLGNLRFFLTLLNTMGLRPQNGTLVDVRCAEADVVAEKYKGRVLSARKEIEEMLEMPEYVRYKLFFLFYAAQWGLKQEIMQYLIKFPVSLTELKNTLGIIQKGYRRFFWNALCLKPLPIDQLLYQHFARDYCQHYKNCTALILQFLIIQKIVSSLLLPRDIVLLITRYACLTEPKSFPLKYEFSKHAIVRNVLKSSL